MAKRYYVRNATGGVKLPITDGDYFTPKLPVGSEGGVFFVAFYDAAGQIVTPDSGTITPVMAPEVGSYGEPSGGDAVINAAQTGEDFSFTVPSFLGPAVEGKITFASISGATVDHAKAYFWRT